MTMTTRQTHGRGGTRSMTRQRKRYAAKLHPSCILLLSLRISYRYAVGSLRPLIINQLSNMLFRVFNRCLSSYVLHSDAWPCPCRVSWKSLLREPILNAPLKLFFLTRAFW